MQNTQFYPLQGGLNLETPAIRTPAGHVIAVENYEPSERGYRRIDGFERFDGRPKPSAASYWLLNFDAGTAAITEGQTVTGATSGATGKALIDAVVSTGTYGGSDAAGYLVLTNVSGTFQDNENLQVSAATKSVANGVAVERGASNDTDDTTWYRDAIETARALIGTVTGSGRIRGIWALNGTAYAFRDNAGGTAGGLFKESTSGWTAVDLGREISFTSGGTTEIAEADVITGAISGATATVKRVILDSGSWAGGDAAGRFILASQTGTFQAENLDVGATLNLATIAGNSSAITLPAGGRYEFVNHNFYGASDRFRMYGVNGVGKAFEFDGTVFVPLTTGMSTDTPNHIEVYKNHLFLSFAGGSLQHSGTGDPYSYTVVTGAGELSIGEDITGLLSAYGKSLIIFGRNKIAELFGSDSTDWVVETLARDAGAIEWTAQQVGVPVYMDDRGVRDLRTTQAYGDFKIGTLSRMVDPIFKSKRANSVTPTASMRVRAKDQYRLFWSDGTAMTFYFGRKTPEVMTVSLGKTVYATCSAEDSNGNEILFFGSDDGYVYQLDAGTSADGSAITAYLRLPFNHVGSPTQNKRWHKVTLEVDAAPSVQIGIVPEFSYGDPNQPQSEEISLDVRGGGGFWNVDNWNDFSWSSPVEGLAEAHIAGLGRNISIAVVTSAIYEVPHTVHGLILHFSYRGLVR